MATWQVIEHVSLTLRRVLQSHVDTTLPTANILVQLATTGVFGELKNANRPTITLFLYRVMENGELRNRAPRLGADGRYARQPLPLELCYMMTPWGVRRDATAAADAQAAQEEHRLLGLILQAFYDHAELSRAELYEDPDPDRPRVWEDTDSVQLVCEGLAVEDHYRIWDSSELPYRLSATYRARVVGIDPSEFRSTGPVVDADFRLTRK
jgi:uncharacterized protein DUF4255